MRDAEIRELPKLSGGQVRVSGWLYNARSSGKLRFLVVRDGSGYLQAVVFRPQVPEQVWADAERLTQESSLRVVGKVRADERAPGGVELQVEELEIVQLCPEYPITPKEHGPGPTRRGGGRVRCQRRHGSERPDNRSNYKSHTQIGSYRRWGR